GTLQTFNFQTWASSSEFINAAYSRMLYEVGLANQFLRDSEDGRLKKIGLTQAEIKVVHQYRAEARWLRALGYYYAMDLFGSVPFKTEKDPSGGFIPPQYNRKQLFEYIESELLAIQDKMVAPRQNQYGRV